MSPVNEDVAATAKKLESILDHNLWPGFDKFKLVQGIIDRNKVLIHEINRNHDARYIHPEGLHRNVDLIRELNANMLKAQELYEAAGGEFYQHAAISRAREAAREV